MRRFYNEFLLANERSMAGEIKSAYLEGQSKILHTYFKTYLQKLLSCKVLLPYSFLVFLLDAYGFPFPQYEEMARREDVVGALQEGAGRRAGGFFGSASAASSRTRLPAAGTKTIFTLGTRHLLLTDAELFLAPVIVPHEGPQLQQQTHEEKVYFQIGVLSLVHYMKILTQYTLYEYSTYCTVSTRK